MTALSLPLDIPPTLTPVMAQYKRLKDAHPHCLLFFRMGDFYELFFEDAVKAAPVLDVALTKRGTQGEAEIPMCGVPVHAYESYLPRLIRAGFHVAIAEQMEEPAEAKKRGGSKAVVDRQVIRVITPGTLTEESFLEATRSNYLAVLAAEAGGTYALAWCDLAQGTPFVGEASEKDVAALLARVSPAELVVSEKYREQEALKPLFAEMKERVSFLPASRFDSANARRVALSHYSVMSLDAFGAFSRAGTTALGVLLDYIELTQKQSCRLQPPAAQALSAMLALDPATRRNLELVQSLGGERRGSLLAAIDRTVSHAGARLLADQLTSPLADVALINKRLARVTFFVAQEKTRRDLRGIFKTLPDLPRALTRLSLKRGSPRDLAALSAALQGSAAARFTLDSCGAALSEDMKACRDRLGEHSNLTDTLTRALRAELPLFARDGGFVAPNYALALDELVTLRDDSKRLIAELQAKYAQETRLPTLKIRHNNVLGYYVEVTPSHADKFMQAPWNETFIHRQTLASAARFTTVELSSLERRAMEAGDKALALELQIFDELVAQVMERFASIRTCAEAMAELDVASSLAELAFEKNWCAPLVDDSVTFKITQGRHPVVEEACVTQGAAFVPNHCDLSEASRLWLITGPNMAGKSTFLRQNALIAILAHIGSYVPAASAHIGLIDKLFSRVGAADDLARGRSTFMVEMVETAAILHQATQRSFVILDEIGRGTATFDGLSLAWGALEYLYHHNACRGLFATHYHELTALKEHLPKLKCATAAIREWEGEIIFLHEVKEGTADRSYGIHVAKLAGLPQEVIARAETLLQELEKERGKSGVTIAPVVPEHMQSRGVVSPPQASALEQTLRLLEPDTLSPRDALEELYRLKTLLK
jgi:DNA mismatch repair protein MutS